MTALKLGERVTFQDASGTYVSGQAWALHENANWYWVIDDSGQTYARKRSSLSTMHTYHKQGALL